MLLLISRHHLRLALAALFCLSLLLAACGSTTPPASTNSSTPLITTDADGNPITIPAKAPQRIISFGATESEMLGALVAPDRVLAVDAATDFPAALAAKPKITDAKGNPNIEQIVALQPDFILDYGKEQGKADSQLLHLNIPVVDLPAVDLSQSLTEIRFVGQLVHETAKANAIVATMQQRIDAVKHRVANAPTPTVYMEIDYSTPGKRFVAGGGSFGDELITLAGGKNIFHSDSSNQGYPEVSDETIISANPQVIVLTEDPRYGGDPSLVYQRTPWAGIDAVKNKHIYAISPDLIQRPGPRIVDGLEQLAKDIHPDL